MCPSSLSRTATRAISRLLKTQVILILNPFSATPHVPFLYPVCHNILTKNGCLIKTSKPGNIYFETMDMYAFSERS